MIEIDLHGCTIEQAQSEIWDPFSRLEKGEVSQLLVITGVGTGALKYYVEKTAEEFNFNWVETNKKGAYLITRKVENDNFFQEDEEDFDADIDEIFNQYKN
ncbi:hypothetical protein HUN03_00135 [Mycoplasmopsis anatis]|uniref:Smr domain-containing protein n=1 Tax=Mycoplasmopsis anatis TaxID=171279 RepID=A0A9Q3LA32_9BACT|nr:Smr/MutS family protein [Mycoplasmopsis anatis]MBW0594459.1 hypothetical protein [Mycoplasmopsis anatis]MBW0595499.1 hypothetical protein [Mycoplasmopsis anatis]MBW0595938.1 hypothetical protein [Mycoplasmopsis anatis]MBW0596657.1 hypothetical protein [Mycoplasmopsis anatis]MBW0597410.1 hypothetical protein [Mycoplasmopsis anatis]